MNPHYHDRKDSEVLMTFADALKESEKCKHAVPVFVIAIAGRANTDATVVCKLKAQRGDACDTCDEREGEQCNVLRKA